MLALWKQPNKLNIHPKGIQENLAELQIGRFYVQYFNEWHYIGKIYIWDCLKLHHNSKDFTILGYQEFGGIN